jgi:hypothetical protein
LRRTPQRVRLLEQRPTLPVNLLVILRRVDGDWLISHYQVSRL